MARMKLLVEAAALGGQEGLDFLNRVLPNEYKRRPAKTIARLFTPVEGPRVVKWLSGGDGLAIARAAGAVEVAVSGATVSGYLGESVVALVLNPNRPPPVSVLMRLTSERSTHVRGPGTTRLPWRATSIFIICKFGVEDLYSGISAEILLGRITE